MSTRVGFASDEDVDDQWLFKDNGFARLVGAEDESPVPALNSPKPADMEVANISEDASLDALLDLADKAPERLGHVAVKDIRAQSLISPDAVFNPDNNASAPVTSTGGLLSQAPGVVTRSTSSLNQDVRIRGYSGSQLVGTTDGANQGRSRLDIDSLFSQIDPELIEEVIVTPGPYSVENGPGFAFFNAKLITPTRSDSFDWTSRSNMGFNTNGRQIMWRETAGFSDRTSGAIFSVGQRMGNDYHPGGNSKDYRVPSTYHVTDVYAALSHDVTERSRLDVSYLHQQIRDTELPGVAYDISSQHGDQANIRWGWRDDFDGIERVNLQFWWHQAAYEVDATQESKQRTFFERLLGEPSPELAGGGYLIGNGLSDNWGARASVLWGDVENWQLRTGADWRRTRQFYREKNYDILGNHVQLGDTFGIPNSSADDFGLFASASARVNDDWSVGAGHRLDAVVYGLDASDLVVTSTDFAPNGVFTPGFDASTRGLSTTYLTSSLQANEQLTLNAGAAYAMRSPNLTELYADQPFAPLVRFGNSFSMGDSTLEPEKNLQFDLGATTKFERMSFGVRGFHSTIHDYIGLAPTNYGTYPLVGDPTTENLGRGRPYTTDPNIPGQNGNADTGSNGYAYRNMDRVTLYGFDLLGEAQIQPWLELAGSLTFTEGINHDPTAIDVYTGAVTQLSQREGLPGIYPLTATATIRFVEPESRRWTLEWQSRAANDQSYLAYSLAEIGTPGFLVHNIHASYRVNDHVKLRSSLLNVFDLNYYEHNSLAIVDRNGNISFVKNPGIGFFTGIECEF